MPGKYTVCAVGILAPRSFTTSKILPSVEDLCALHSNRRSVQMRSVLSLLPETDSSIG